MSDIDYFMAIDKKTGYFEITTPKLIITGHGKVRIQANPLKKWPPFVRFDQPKGGYWGVGHE